MNEIRIYLSGGMWYWEEDQNNQGFGPFQSIEDAARDIILEIQYRQDKESEASYGKLYGIT